MLFVLNVASKEENYTGMFVWSAFIKKQTWSIWRNTTKGMIFIRDLSFKNHVFSAVIEFFYWLIPKLLSKFAPHIYFSVAAFVLIFAATRSIELAFEYFKIVWMVFGLAAMMTPVGLIRRKIFQDII